MQQCGKQGQEGYLFVLKLTFKTQCGWSWWFFAASSLMHHTANAPLLPEASSGNGPISNFWTPLWALCSLTIHVPCLLFLFLLSSYFPCLSTILDYRFDSSASPPNKCVTLYVHNSQPQCARNNSKHDGHYTLMCSAYLLCSTLFLSYRRHVSLTYKHSYIAQI